MACIIEIWTMVGDKQMPYSPACLSYGWHGGDGSRLEAEQEPGCTDAATPPWIMARGQRPGWEGDPRGRPA